MVEKCRHAIIGGPGGPTSLAVADNYLLDSSDCLLITQSKPTRGAAQKGIKYATSIVPKFPDLRLSNMDVYNHINNLLNGSAANLAQLFAGSSAYIPLCEIGIRACRNGEEFDVLNNTRIKQKAFDTILKRDTSRFLNTNFGVQLSNNHLYAYQEKAWDLQGYLDRMEMRIPRSKIRKATDVTVEDGSDCLILHLHQPDGTANIIHAESVFVCRGVGNINFERKINPGLAAPGNFEAIHILEYYKTINNSANPIPAPVSSIFLPGQSICITNEFGSKHGLLHNAIDKSSQSVTDWLNSSSAEQKTARRQLMDASYTSLPATRIEDFMCAMTVPKDTGSAEKLCHFTVSNSKIKNIHYVNIPFFSTIGIAAASLPKF